AINVPAGRLPWGSSASSPGASPEASCHDDAGAPPLSFFFDSGSATAPSLLVLTTDHAPAEVADAAGAAGSAGAIGSAGRGAGACHVVAVSWTWVAANGDSAAGTGWEGFSERPCGAMVRCLAARTLCSICERLAEYIERLSTDLRRSTKKTATMPTIATSGPARRYAIGADYRGSVHV